MEFVTFLFEKVRHPEPGEGSRGRIFAAVICLAPRCIGDQTNRSARSALSEILQLRFRMTD